ncbi:MAG: RtcB family protein [Clostridia bacterium]|nr:RtcB family protein [Clostridia bacterium]
MIEIRGRWNTALCYCDEIEQTAREQIQQMCDQRIFADSRIRIMPDVHAGKGCTIGTTMTVGDFAVPSLVGVDIGCGMETIMLAEREIDFDALDKVIRAEIPSGMNVRRTPHPLTGEIDLRALKCFSAIDSERASLSLGTLGGGNHFIEADRDEDGRLYLVIHSGSRHLGQQTAGYYQKLGLKAIRQAPEQRRRLIDQYKAEGRTSEIERALAALKASGMQTDIPEQFAWVKGKDLEDYIHDMRLVQRYAVLNRQAMAQTILEHLRLHETDRFTTIHNYIDTEHRILRKGSVSAQKGERLLIPINMRDGALICEGKGNPEWNCSAPHGAGRLMSRKAAQSSLTVEQFRREMAGVYTTCVSRETLDESPMAYKGIDAILSQIGPTAEVIRRIMPVYNYKAN